VEYKAITIFGLVLSASAAVYAAGPHAVLKGRVTDASGAAVAGAVVVLREFDGLAQRRVTDELGYYKFDGLSPATYSIRIAEPRFRPYDSTDIKVKGTTVLDRQLAPPSPARTITASGVVGRAILPAGALSSAPNAA